VSGRGDVDGLSFVIRANWRSSRERDAEEITCRRRGFGFSVACRGHLPLTIGYITSYIVRIRETVAFHRAVIARRIAPFVTNGESF